MTIEPDDLGRGALAGVGSTVVMTGWMLLAERAGWMSELAPTRITRRSLERLPDGPPRGEGLTAATSVLHLAVGAGAGAAYASLADHPRLQRVPRLARGLVFGTALWATAYVGVLPAIGVMPPPERDERRRPAAMLIAHWIFGVTLAMLHRSSPDRSRRSARPEARLPS
jgi:hypothetical protein